MTSKFGNTRNFLVLEAMSDLPWLAKWQNFSFSVSLILINTPVGCFYFLDICFSGLHCACGRVSGVPSMYEPPHVAFSLLFVIAH